MYKIILEHYNIFVIFYEKKNLFTSDPVKKSKIFPIFFVLYILFLFFMRYENLSFLCKFSSFDDKFLHHNQPIYDVNSNEIQHLFKEKQRAAFVWA